MTDNIKIIAQSAPAAGVLDPTYTVPPLTSTVLSSLVVCNRGSTPALFRCSVAIGGAADTNAQYLYFDVTVPGNDTFVATIGVTMATTDVFRTYSNNGGLSFNLFGTEVT